MAVLPLFNWPNSTFKFFQLTKQFIENLLDKSPQLELDYGHQTGQVQSTIHVETGPAAAHFSWGESFLPT